jgi:hypothetical protein
MSDPSAIIQLNQPTTKEGINKWHATENLSQLKSQHQR